MLVDIVPVHPRELFQYFFLVMPSHFLSVAPLFHLAIYFILKLSFHVLGHLLVILELAQTVHIILFLVKLKGIETMLLLLLVVELLSCLLLLYLLLRSLEFLVDGLEHPPLLISFLLLLFLWVYFEQLFRDVEELPQVRILGLKLLDVELIGLNDRLANMAIVLYQGNLEFIDFVSVEFAFTFQLCIVC